jgi:hypothetical protein
VTTRCAGVIMGSTLASFCVEAFSLDRLLAADAQGDRRPLPAVQRLTHFEDI